MDALKLRRTTLRTAFTKAINHFQEIIENDPVHRNAVETAFEMLDAKGVTLKKIDEDILELMIESNYICFGTEGRPQPGHIFVFISASSQDSVPAVFWRVVDWLGFHNQFKRIHEDKNIDDGDKFQYLIQATNPNSRARDIVESFPATPENYRKAFEYLRMWFGQEDV
ncbi:uncharacterized protein TNCV_2272341 [Trichonephila clavipes]|nr:uncharacterized protein TNCV_2272341 [Trichonephila clavipes]